MFIPLKTKIWMTVFSIVLMFTFFTLYYFPKQQGDFLLKSYNAEIQNLAYTVALGVQIALKEDDFEGVQSALNYVKGNAALKFISLVQTDTSWNMQRTKFIIKETVFKTYPDSIHPSVSIVSSDSLIVKKAPFHSPLMSGNVLLAFTSNEINESKKNIRAISLWVSSGIFLIGILIGLWLSRNISVPVIKLRNAVRRVGEGDLTQAIETYSNDEVGRTFQRRSIKW
jgi:methyl-accepting chemotaxis protein